MHRTVARLTIAAGAAGAALLLLAPVAGAHIGTSADEVPAGGRLTLGLSVGHGCDGSPTTKVAIQIPEDITNATAFVKPGWTVTSDKETLAEPIESAHGDPVTERVSVITFTAAPGNALPNELRDTFSINFTAPDTEGETLYFKTVQTCEAGENAWIQEYDGTGEEPDSPAPIVKVTEAEGDGHGATEEVAAEPTSSTDDADGTALAIVALIIGLAGLAVGTAGFARARKTT